MNALCPDCKDADGEILSRKLGDPSGLTVTFECPACDHRWSVSF